MTKSELIESVATLTKQDRSSVAKTLNALTNILEQTTLFEDVLINGFGTFYVLRHRKTVKSNKSHGKEFHILKFRQSRRSRNGKARSRN